MVRHIATKKYLTVNDASVFCFLLDKQYATVRENGYDIIKEYQRRQQLHRMLSQSSLEIITKFGAPPNLNLTDFEIVQS